MNGLHNHFPLVAGMALAAGMACASCGEDRSGEYVALTQEDRWIEAQMQQMYLWYYDMPEQKEENYFAEPADFFQSLLSKSCRGGKGDTFSTFESTKEEEPQTGSNLRIDETSSYGFDFMIYTDPTETTAHRMARVLFVLPDSPAAEAGLRRGDWITKVGDNYVTQNNYGYLMQGGATTFTVAALHTAVTGEGTALTWGEEKTLSVGPSRMVSSNPFYRVELFENLNGSGLNVGYLMYDHYSPGPGDEGTEYDEEMRRIFADFKSRGVDEFILDLRYNLGGVMTCITELCSYLAPPSALGQPLFSLEYNNLNPERNSTASLNPERAAQNLGLTTLYVITSPYTASASEATIYCLRPYMQVRTVGSTTVGKNVASLGLVSPYDFTLHPIVATVYNSLGESDYENGIQPDLEYNEFSDPAPLGEIGDPENDALLRHTLEWILSPTPTGPQGEGLKSFRSSPFGGVEGAGTVCSLSFKSVQGNRIMQ